MNKQPIGLMINSESVVCLICGEHHYDHELVDRIQPVYSDGYPDGFTCVDCCEVIQPLLEETAQ
jgi:hypothetical protein